MTHIIRVEIDRHHDWYIATSKDLPGLFLANPDLRRVYGDVPAAIKLLFKEKHKLDVTVKEASMPESRPISELVYTAETMIEAA